MTDLIVVLEHVSKSFGRVNAVHDLSLSVESGSIVSLLGPSGCGKTTTLRIIAGLEKPDEGVVHLTGRVVADPNRGISVLAHKRNVGMVFQSYAIWPHMTVAENVAYALKFRGLAKALIQEKVLAVLDLVGLSGLQGRPATALSGGQQQRVALARALIYEPPLLLLDEPFSNLDAKLREQMRIELKLLQRKLGITVIFVTHDQIEALSLSDKIFLMNQGKIEQSGTPQELYEEPTTPFARDFLGKTVILRGKLCLVNGRALVDIGGFTFAIAQEINRSRLQEGAPLYCAIRPEHVCVRPAEAIGAAINALPGNIETLLFVGDHYEARVQIPPAERILLYLPKASRWTEGQRITVELPPERLTLWNA
jgi:ABC-type Fe3+/spermidine/putrescine transport system ATPase subunit